MILRAHQVSKWKALRSLFKVGSFDWKQTLDYIRCLKGESLDCGPASLPSTNPIRSEKDSGLLKGRSFSVPFSTARLFTPSDRGSGEYMQWLNGHLWMKAWNGTPLRHLIASRHYIYVVWKVSHVCKARRPGHQRQSLATNTRLQTTHKLLAMSAIVTFGPAARVLFKGKSHARSTLRATDTSHIINIIRQGVRYIYIYIYTWFCVPIKSANEKHCGAYSKLGYLTGSRH